jgi:hypothetical protein
MAKIDGKTPYKPLLLENLNVKVDTLQASQGNLKALEIDSPLVLRSSPRKSIEIKA